MTDKNAVVGYIVYDKESGEPLKSGSCSFRDVVVQVSHDGSEEVIPVPRKLLIITSVDMPPVIAMLEAQVDEAANTLIAPGMKPIYARKIAEARAGRGAVIEAEAAALGLNVADLAATILARAEEQSLLEVRVETARRLAKAAIRAAPNVGKAHQASQVDWDEVCGRPTGLGPDKG